MGNKKIYELAKEINKTNKETIEIANSLGIEVKSHLNSITDEEANKIIASLNKKEIKKETKDNSVNVEKTEKYLGKYKYMHLKAGKNLVYNSSDNSYYYNGSWAFNNDKAYPTVFDGK